MSTAAALAVLGVTLAGWAYVFLPTRAGIWRRTWITAAATTGAAVVALTASGELGEAVGGVDATTIVAGLGVGIAWLAATHLGHVVLCRAVPSFIARVRELYSIAAGDRRRDVLIALVAMAIAEEFVFRAVAQREFGIVVAVAAYTLVQLVERNWALMLAAIASGTVWGLLYEWQQDLVATVIAHVVWTGVLTFVWPLRGCDGTVVPEAAEVAITEVAITEPDRSSD